MKVFGREPAAWLGLLSGVLALFLSLDQFGLTGETVGLIMAFATAAFGVYTAWATKDTMLGVIVGLVNATVALFAGYGLELSADTTAAVVALVTVAVGFYQRTQTSPLATPTFGAHAAGAEVAR